MMTCQANINKGKEREQKEKKNKFQINRTGLRD